MKKAHNNTRKESIITEFNRSREHFDKCQDLLEGNPVAAQQELNEAGGCLYTAYENGLKNYLYRRYEALFKGEDEKIKISWKEKEKLIKILDTGNQNYGSEDKNKKSVDGKYLSDQMDKYALPKKSDTDIDFEIIKKNSWEVTNKKKHHLDDIGINKFKESYAEIRKFILTYIDSNADIERVQSVQYEELQEECDYWDDDSRYNFCLISDRTTLTGNQLQKLLYINWSLIIDFDTDSISTGLWKSYIDEYGMEPNAFNIQNPENTEFNFASKLPYWFHITGVSEYPETIIDSDRKWIKKYSSVVECLKKYRMVFTKPLKVIILNGNAMRIANLIGALDAVYDDYYKLYLLSKETQFDSIKTTYQEILKFYPLYDYELVQGIANYSSLFNRVKFVEGHSVYGKSGIVTVKLENYSCFEIPYLGISDTGSSLEKDSVAFYQGRQVLSWYGAQNGFAINRFPQIKEIKYDIVKSSKETSSKIIRLCHDPGAGGTTLSRMIAYELSKEMPVMLLKSFNDKIATVQIENFYQQVSTSILVVVESSILNEEELRRIKGELMAKAIPHIFLYVCRIRKKMPYEYGSFKLKDLNDNEFDDMLNKLEPFIETESKNIIARLKPEDRYPFFMSMYAFEEKFAGVEEYIKHFLVNISDIDYSRLSYISLVDKYANRPLDISFLTGTYKDDFDIFQDSVNEKLITKEYRERNCYVKIRHPRFASTILEKRIAPNGEYDKSTQATNLSQLIVEFINYSKQNVMFDQNSTIEVLKNLLIIRDASSMVYNKFSPVIEELKELVSNEIAEKEKYNCIGLIFKKLVDVYPNEPHFRGHLSRYYTNIEKNYVRGIEEAKKAVELSEAQNSHDALLYHIYGMSIKKYVEERLCKEAEEYYSYDEFQAFNSLETKIKEEIELASEQFRKVRESKNNKIAGYISDIEMCINIIDFGKAAIYDCSTEEFLKKYRDSWYMQYYDRALTLMEGFKSIQVEEDTEFYKVKLTTRCMDSLQSMVDGIENTIEMWESYLQSARDIQRPVIRRFIARAKARLISDPNDTIYLQNINEILKLMEDNIREEPENGANIRIWFDALRHSESNNPEILLDEAVQKLSTWKRIGDNYEAHYYFFILNCIKAIEGNSVAESILPQLLDELKTKTTHIPNNHTVYEWLGKGKGVKRLINAYEEYRTESKQKKYRRRPYDAIVENGELVEGRISLYKSDRHAEIRGKNLNRLGVLFTPNAQEYRVTEVDIGKSVKFVLGFTYSGLRALNKSVRFVDYTVSLNDESMQVPQKGELVKCKIQRKSVSWLQVLLTDYNCSGSIYENMLPRGKNFNDYHLDEMLWGRVVGTRDGKGGRTFYQIKIEEETKSQRDLLKFKKTLENETNPSNLGD